MDIIKTDERHNITSLRRSGEASECRLNWSSEGFETFIVLVGENKASVSIDAGNFNAGLQEAIEESESILAEGKSVFLQKPRVYAHLVTFVQLKRDGGFVVDGHPGIYAVYGCSLQGGTMTIYAQENNICQIKVDVTISDTPIMTKKGILKKTDVYTGYHKIGVPNKIQGLETGTIYYIVDNGPCKYPVPIRILNNSGFFYVKCNEYANINFYTHNNDGINLIVNRGEN